MKKLFSLLFVALLTMSAWADTSVTIDFTAQGYTGGQQVHELTVGDVTVTFDKGTNTNNPPAYYTGGDAVRLYPGNSMTVSAETNIKKIDFTFGSNDNTNDILCDVGSYNKAGKQWTIGSSDPSTAVVFSVAGTSGHRRIQTLVVTIEEANPVTELVPPVFNPNGGTFSGSLAVTLTCATQNCDIFWFYGTEEDQGVHNHYNGPIYVTETTTLTAYSVKGGEMSEYVTVTFTKVDQTVEAPVFTPASCEFTDRLNVTLTCATPNAKIYYSLDNELWSQYEDAIPVTDDLTIWAKAKVGDVESEVVSATYTKVTNTTEIVFDPNVDLGTGDDYGRHAFTVTKYPVTLYTGDGMITTNGQYRFYGPNDSSGVVISSVGAPIVKIEVFGLYGYQAGRMTLTEESTGTWTTSGLDGVWEGNSDRVAFRLSMQARFTKIIVTVAGTIEPEWALGDVNHDGFVNVTDATLLNNMLLNGVTDIPVEADMNQDEVINITDLTELINYLINL